MFVSTNGMREKECNEYKILNYTFQPFILDSTFTRPNKLFQADTESKTLGLYSVIEVADITSRLVC